MKKNKEIFYDMTNDEARQWIWDHSPIRPNWTPPTKESLKQAVEIIEKRLKAGTPWKIKKPRYTKKSSA